MSYNVITLKKEQVAFIVTFDSTSIEDDSLYDQKGTPHVEDVIYLFHAINWKSTKAK